MRFPLVKTALLLPLAVAVSSCGNLGYYMQSVRGQLELLNARVPIADVLAEPDTPAELKAKLEFVLRVREFASHALHLPDNASYRGYSDLKREHVVWNVFATPELSLELREWCFLVAGCVRYRGYFAESDAESYGHRLRGEGNDVFVAGIDAYSTLGWFDDPVLNTFIRRSENFLAGLIFHELAHQRIYVKGDTTFNESFARTVEVEGVRRWLSAVATPERQQVYEREVERQRQFVALIATTRSELKAIYASAASDDEKRSAKRDAFEKLSRSYAERRKEWNGFDRYDKWFATSLNNAKLGSVGAYTEKVPAFETLLRSNGNDFEKFFAAVEQLGALPADDRNARLADLAAMAR